MGDTSLGHTSVIGELLRECFLSTKTPCYRLIFAGGLFDIS